jgi:hypothetical protein
MKKLNTIFFIYTEASAAVFMACIALLEFVCFLMLPANINMLPLAASAIFTCIAGSMATYVYCDAKRTKLI